MLDAVSQRRRFDQFTNSASFMENLWRHQRSRLRSMRAGASIERAGLE